MWKARFPEIQYRCRQEEEVTLRGWLRSVTDLESLALVCNGQEVERIEFSRNTQRYDLETQLQIERSGWCHLRAEGAPGDRFPMMLPTHRRY